MGTSVSYPKYYDDIVYHCLLPLIRENGYGWEHQDDEGDE